MSLSAVWERVQRYYEGRAARLVFKRPLVIKTAQPLISFTFDDFPQSALLCGGSILNRSGLAGTYYASFGLVGQEGPSGRIFAPADLRIILEQGHELGCHTFSHCHSWNTLTPEFEESIIKNRTALHDLLPEAEFRTFSYPICPPRPLTKSMVARHFLCSRAGGQTFNVGTTDLNQLAAYFLEQSGGLQNVKDVIDRNCHARGWLIFGTHDIAEHPTRFGCTPGFFEDVVRYAVSSGARILPVVKVLERLKVSGVL